jgi:hypothetical protein
MVQEDRPLFGPVWRGVGFGCPNWSLRVDYRRPRGHLRRRTCSPSPFHTLSDLPICISSPSLVGKSPFQEQRLSSLICNPSYNSRSKVEEYEEEKLHCKHIHDLELCSYRYCRKPEIKDSVNIARYLDVLGLRFLVHFVMPIKRLVGHA